MGRTSTPPGGFHASLGTTPTPSPAATDPSTRSWLALRSRICGSNPACGAQRAYGVLAVRDVEAHEPVAVGEVGQPADGAPAGRRDELPGCLLELDH